MTTEKLTLTLYYVGETPEEALEGLPFDSAESASDYMLDNPGTRLFAASAVVDPTTIEDVTDQ